MSATSVGEIGLDLVVNSSGFNRQVSKMESLAKKAGATFASAFAVKKLADFGSQCIKLGSDLAEVQNVVDVTFSSMSADVDKFAKSAISNFGLSETMAKQYTGTFGAMAKAFGFAEDQAYDMSTTLTGLAGDVASFYNLSQNEAYTKLKSVFTGETESLKDLGVVMTQTALDNYALANGFGVTTSAMSEQEKVALRYRFVLDQLSLAQGDFARTSDSWANQTRIMALQIQSIMASIGQGLINLFTPAIKMINALLAKIAKLAEAFKGFSELITGKKSGGGSGITDTLADTAIAADDAGSGLANAADQADNLADNAGAVGSAAKKAAKEMRSLMGFDEIQFDYIRFPDGAYNYEKAGTIDYRNTYGESKAQAVQRFLLYAAERLHSAGYYLSGDVFGECANPYVTACGQYWPAISAAVDAISGMPYPDHYSARGDYKPWEHPYDTVHMFGAAAAERQTETASPGAVRTWIQAYNALWEPYNTYGEAEVAAEVKALRDTGCTGGFMTWNGGSDINKYQSIIGALR